MQIKIVENFIEEEDARILISEIQNASETNPYPEYYKNRNGGTAFPYNNRVMSILKKYGEKANRIQENFFNLNDRVIITKAFGSSWDSNSKSGAPHIDAVDLEPFIEYSTVIYLNDEFEGGEIYFPHKDFIYKPIKYSAVFFPGNKYEYEHGVNATSSGNRYTALFMQSTQQDFMDPDFKEC